MNLKLIKTLIAHLPEYLIEAALLGLFMISACFFTAMLEHPGSPVRRGLEDPILRRFLIGIAMGLTAIALIKSPWGRRSGAHMNPAFTLSFFRLGKIAPLDALGYTIAQVVGGILGVLISAWVLGMTIADPSVNYAVTVPGASGVWTAWIAEFAISFLLMMVVLSFSNRATLVKGTPVVVGILIATYITFEAPYSGMSMNPARTVGSAFAAHLWTGLWVYFTAPTLAMLVASEIYVRFVPGSQVYCAKLYHDTQSRCIFRCRFKELIPH